MRLVFILALLFITQGIALDEHKVHVTAESKLESYDEAAADDHLHKLEKRAVSSSSCLASLYVMAFTSGIQHASSDSTYQIQLQYYGGTVQTFTFYDRPGDDYLSNKGDLWQFGFSGCITLSTISRVSIVAESGTDGWNIGSVVTLVGDSQGRIQVLTRDFNANFWIDTDNSRYDRPFVLSFAKSDVGSGTCLTLLYIIAFTSGITNSQSDTSHSIQLESNGVVRTVSLYDRPGDDYQSHKGDLWSMQFSSFHFSDSCIRIPEIQRVSLVESNNDGWNIQTIVTLVSGSNRLQVLTQDFSVNRWIDGNGAASHRRFDLSFADINECTLNTDECSHNCTNTVGSYTCSCRSGYQLAADGRSCQDINECTLNTDECSHNCSNTVGSYTCSCRSGYLQLAADGRSCQDINECDEETDGCAQNCTNTNGSYSCSCNTGYRLGSDAYSCYDVDECQEGNHLCNQTCTNTVGSYMCQCNAGYSLGIDETTCFDINECDEETDGCVQNCTNTAGSYTCSCNTGYHLSSDGHSCYDIDECQEETHQCAQMCINTVGSYMCQCNAGYTLGIDETACLVLAVPTLLSVHRISGSSATVDWIPLTQNEERGLLTSLEIAYQPVLNTTLNCSNFEFVDSETIFVRENLFEQRSANITDLEPNCEYCIAIRVRTSGGDSRFSSSIKLSLPEGILFQIKLGFPDDSESNCFNFVVENFADKVSAIAQFIAQRIMQGCQCQYSARFIVSGQLFCASKNSVIYQAQLIPTDNKTALEVRNITQQWVLSGSAITINSLSYKVDPSCSIVVNELGVFSCHVSESQPNHNNHLPVITVSVSLIGLMLTVCVGSVIFFIVCYLHRTKTKSHSLGTSDVQQSPPDIAVHLKYSTDDTDVYVDMSSGDPAQNESKVDESMAVCHKVAADSDSAVDGLIKKNAYSKDEGKQEVIENIYETIPGEAYQDN